VVAPARFVTRLGAYSDDGAILLSRRDGRRPVPGIHRITADPAPEDIEVVIVAGSATRPTGIFRAEREVVAITTVSRRRMTGEFELGPGAFSPPTLVTRIARSPRGGQSRSLADLREARAGHTARHDAKGEI
jgi:hypothetical protein